MTQEIDLATLTRDRVRVLFSDRRAVELANEGQRVRALIPIIPQLPVELLTQGIQEYGEKWKALDEERKNLTRPIRDDEALVNEIAKPALTGWKAFVDACKTEVIRRQQEVKQQQAALQLEASKAFQAGQPDRGVAVLTQVPVAAETPGLSVADHWVAEVVDASSVPRELCVPSQALLDAVLKSYGPNSAPPAGVRYVNKPIARRTGR